MLSEQTVYSWRKHFNGLEPNDVKRFNALDMRTMPRLPVLAIRHTRYPA